MEDKSTNPLEAYSAAIATVIEIARGESKSQIRLEAARILLENCAVPPWVDWGVEPDEE